MRGVRGGGKERGGAGTEREELPKPGGRAGGANQTSAVPAPPFATNPPPGARRAERGWVRNESGQRRRCRKSENRTLEPQLCVS